MIDENTVGVEKPINESSEKEELKVLKQRADLMGVKYSPNIGLNTLKERIKAAQEPESDGPKEPSKNQGKGGTQVKDLSPAQKKRAMRERLKQENLRLVRVRVTCMDPKKRDLPGEVFTVANEYLGTVRKFVPFGEATDGGYHIPYCILKLMRSKKFLDIQTKRDRRTGQIEVKYRWVREFAIEEMPQLTKADLKDLAKAQQAAGSYEE